MKIRFFNQTKQDTVVYENLIKKVLKKQSIFKSINYIFVSEDDILKMNKQYRDKDYVTDVISFPNNDKQLGDIFICLDKAFIQAKEYNHSIQREVGFLAVHGYLHLIGYDHLTKEEEEIMFALQEKILSNANLKRSG